MRRRLLACLVTVFAVLVLAPTTALAEVGQQQEVGGLTYEITSEDPKTVKLVNPIPTDYSPYSGEIAIPETVQIDEASYTVTEIGMQAFAHSEATSVSVPKTVTVVGDTAFLQCGSLETVAFADGAKLTSIGAGAFRDCGSLSGLVIPESVQFIGAGAFNGCNSLATLTIPAGVTEGLVDALFYNNAHYPHLEGLSIAEGSPYAIDEESGVLYKGTVAEKWLGLVADVSLRLDTTSISDKAFSMGSQNENILKSVVVPEGVTAIPTAAFYGAHQLERVSLPSTITSVGVSAFEGCEALTSIEIPDGVQIINRSTFSGCLSLKDVSIPDSVTSIGDSAFKGCAALEDISLPGSVKSIGANAYQSCSGLVDVALPEGLESIGTAAFAMCNNLGLVVVPSAVTEVGSMAFAKLESGMAGPITVVFLGEMPPTTLDSNAFYGRTDDGAMTVIVPAGSEQAYASNTVLGACLKDDSGNIKPGSSYALVADSESVTVDNGSATTVSLAGSQMPDDAMLEVRTNDGTIATAELSGDGKTITVSGLSEGQTSLTVKLSLSGIELASFEVPVTVNHVHEYATDWTSDETGHWHACVANDGSQSGFASHTLEWVVDEEPQVGIAGSKHQVCAVCGWAGPTVEIPALEPEPDPEPEPTPATHTVTLVFGNGEKDAQLSVEDGKLFARPNDPSLQGYEFAGWFLTRAADGTLTDEYDFSEPVTSDLTLYAGWLPVDSKEDEPPVFAGASKGDVLAQTGDVTSVTPMLAFAGAGASALGVAIAVRRKR